VFWKDRNLVYLGCNTAFALDAGMRHPNDLIGKNDYQMGWALQAELYRADDQWVIDTGISKLSYVEPQTTPEGKQIYLLTSKVPLRDAENQIIGVLGIYTDITDEKKAKDELRIAATVFEAQEGMLVTDAHGDILKVNHAFTEISGYSAEEVVGKNPRLLSSRIHDPSFYAAMWGEINNIGKWEGEIWNRRKTGEVYPEHLTITAVKDSTGSTTNYVATFTDITHSKADAEKIEHLAFYDPLTKLPNRRLLVDRMQQAFASSARNGKIGALLFIDLDNFKNLNDTLGHDTGDVLLQQVAERLNHSIREGDTVARFGGDEFVVMLEGLSEQPIEAAAQAETIGNKILASLNVPYELGTHPYHCTPSIGITLFNDHEHEVEVLLKQADLAMYQAKNTGRNTLRFFDPEMQESINQLTAIERELRLALEKQQFQLYYQIQVDSDGHALGAEALIRWIHPDRGLVSPLQFIPVAEESGLILPIGQWVLETACAQIKAWEQNERTRNLLLSINVSARQFRQSDFVTQIHAAIQRLAINPSRLKLELTESILLESVVDTISTMNSLNEMGVQFSLDDFGTGYSSLQYLKKLPLEQIKIDKSFVRDITFDEQDRSIVRAIIAMAHSLELEVIAEGVETEEQKQLLLNKGCSHFQGYLFGKPMPIEEFIASLN
jgi:diguanylate cyclase (GGDEF)-like protein/PAS domain S-box-containing protein